MEELKAIAKFLEGFRLQDLLREIYGDVARPGAKQAGKALETVLGFGNTLLLPLTFANDRAQVFRKNMGKYRARMQDTPIEDTCEVAPEIGVPIAEKLTYVTNEELSKMYVELLAKASQVQHANVAHPSFVNIINNISSDEAIILESLKNVLEVLFIEVHLKKVGKSEYIVAQPLLLELSCLADLTYPNNVAAYFSNLEGLGVLNVGTSIWLSDDSFYEPLEAHAWNKFSGMVGKVGDRELASQRGRMDITPFGMLFLSACYSSEKR